MKVKKKHNKNHTGQKCFHAYSVNSFSMVLLALTATGVIGWLLVVETTNSAPGYDVIVSTHAGTGYSQPQNTPQPTIDLFSSPNTMAWMPDTASSREQNSERTRTGHVATLLPSKKAASPEYGNTIKMPEATMETLLSRRTQKRTSREQPAMPDGYTASATTSPVSTIEPVTVAINQPVSFPLPVALSAASAFNSEYEPGLFTLNLPSSELSEPSGQNSSAKQSTPRTAPSRKKNVAAVGSSTAFASPYGEKSDVDDFFTLKLHGMYGSSRASFDNPGLGEFSDHFLVLGGQKKFEFADLDAMKLDFDGVITTNGKWDNDELQQKLSGFTVNVGPEFKFPELPMTLDANLGVGWLKRDATKEDPFGVPTEAEVKSLVYGGGLALRGDWQWRMLKVGGLLGVQYAAAREKSHTFRDVDGNEYDYVDKRNISSWEVPVQMGISGEYRLLNALTVTPSLWGGYTFNVAGDKGQPFHNGHLAGAESTWRRNGVTWNKDHWHLGGEARFRIVDRIDLWFDFQKEWAGKNSGKYYGGGLKIAF